MAATFAIEIGLMAFVILRYGLATTLRRLTALSLLCLAIFQLAEYNVCGRFNIDALAWSRIGFVAITLLPPLGMHIVHVLANIKSRHRVWASYLLASIWVYIFALSPVAFRSHECAGNYAIFQLTNGYGGLFFSYYYILMFIAILIAGRALSRATKRRAKALKALIAGYFFFIIPTTIVNMINPDTLDGIPSIMCGFAVLFAITLVTVVLPNGDNVSPSARRRKKKSVK